MSHWDAYRKGLISLKQARHLQGLKLAGLRAKGKKKKAIMTEYRLQEKLLNI